ncbi:MAG TPA: Ig-like domain-containing protein [Actinoplanes sp.]|nr:Ig-like domain-containing protein [Actinoplanes sp.]
MTKTTTWRALAGLAAITPALALSAPAQAATRPLVAGPAAHVSAGPGGVVNAPISVTNIGDAAVDGTGLWYGLPFGYATPTRYANCVYSLLGELHSCRFDQVLEPGKTYRVDLPLIVPADEFAPGALTIRFDWMTGRDYDLVVGKNGPSGTGEVLRLVEDTAPGTPHVTSWQTVEVDVTGRQGADLAVTGAKASGAVGDVVPMKATVRNNGPATLDWVLQKPSPGLVVVTIPPGSTVVSVPSNCKATTTGRYECEAPRLFRVGTAYGFTFTLRIDRVSRDATGKVEVNPACDCERFDADLDRSNDVAELVLNPSPTVPGGTDTNPPVISATGLTEGQWIGWFPRFTPAWSDDVAVTKAQILVDGAVVQTYEGDLPREVTFQTPWSVDGQEAQVTVRAFDAAGNSSERSTRVRADVRLPSATITPAFGARLTGVATFQATGVDADTTRIEIVDWDGRVVADSTAAPWTLTWDTRGETGDSFVSVRVFDKADNAAIDVGTYHLDNSGPSITAVTPGERSLVRGTVRTTAKVSDPAGIRSSGVTGGRSAGAGAWTLTPKAQGPFTFTWTATDKLGNTSTARRTVVNDTVVPALKLTKAPKNNARLAKSTVLKASASDKNGIARVQFLVNGKVTATGSTFTLNPKKYGKKFTVQVRAYDKAGNVKTLPKRTYRR